MDTILWTQKNWESLIPQQLSKVKELAKPRILYLMYGISTIQFFNWEGILHENTKNTLKCFAYAINQFSKYNWDRGTKCSGFSFLVMKTKKLKSKINKFNCMAIHNMAAWVCWRRVLFFYFSWIGSQHSAITALLTFHLLACIRRFSDNNRNAR